MWHKLYKKLLMFWFIAIVVGAVFPSCVLVHGASQGRVSIYEDVAEVSDRNTVLTRGNYLNYGTITLSRIDPMKIRITGDTAAHIVCDKLAIGFYLDKSSDGDQFVSYRHWNFSKENDSFFWKGLELIVPAGQWYRLRGSHIAIVGDDGESITTITDGLYVY